MAARLTVTVRQVLEDGSEAAVDGELAAALEAPGHPQVGSTLPEGVALQDDPGAALAGCDVAIDFTVPAAALAARFVVRPMLRDVIEAIRNLREPTSPELERRLADLEEGQQLISERLNHLIVAERFQQQLHSGSRTESS